MTIKNKIYVVVISLIMAATVGPWIVFYNIKDIRKLNQEIYSQKVVLEKIYQQTQSLKERIQELKDLEQQIQELTKIFIPSQNPLLFITSLENVANANALKEKIDIGILKKIDGSIDKALTKITLEGDFTNFISYLTSLEKMDYYLNINSLKISKTADSTNPLLSIILIGESFWRKE